MSESEPDIQVTLKVDGSQFTSAETFETLLDDLWDALDSKFVDVDYTASLRDKTAEITFYTQSSE